MLTNLIQVLSAFVGTKPANRGTGKAGEDQLGSAVAQIGDAQHAGDETLVAWPNAVGQVDFVFASVEATDALPRAPCTGFDASLELVSVHGNLFAQG